MKTLMKHIRAIALTVILILLLQSSTYAATPKTTITPKQAADLAIFYYCLNATNDDIIDIDEYVATPLYDDSGNITYYCIDFFYQDVAKGYVVVGADLKYIQCPELCPGEQSIYYSNALIGLISIYYNPYEIFFVDENETAFYNLYNEVSEETVDGALYEGDIKENRELLQLVSGTIDPLTDRNVFTQHPVTYLESIGYTSVTSGDYGSIESAMDSAGAFNLMFTVTQNNPYTLSTGTKVYYGGHCAITQVSNIMRYLKTKYTLNYPSTYEKTFDAVLNKAVSLGYFTNTFNGSGVSNNNIKNLFLKVNEMYGYTGSVQRTSGQNADWSFLTNKIDAGIPVLLGLSTQSNTFTYAGHLTVAFGYNSVSGWRDNSYDIYSFVKFYDGHPQRGKCYVCWDMLTYFDVDNEDGAQIFREMWALYPRS